MLRALAAAPAGLTTPQLAELASATTSWVNALSSTRQLMLKQQRQGRVEQAGTVAGDRTRESVLWRITADGEQYIKEADASEAAGVYSGPLTELVALALSMMGSPGTTAQVYEYIAGLGEPFTFAQVKSALFWAHRKSDPYVGKTQDGLWCFTEAGTAWLITECGE